MRFVLQERGIDTSHMVAEQMFYAVTQTEKSKIERFLVEERGQIMCMLPKFHCELNPIERVWAQAKQYSKAYCKYSIKSLRNIVHPALDSVPLESIQKHYRKVRHYMFAYLEGIPGGSDLEKLVRL